MRLASVLVVTLRLACMFSSALSAVRVDPAIAVTVISDGFNDGNNMNSPDGINWFVHSGPSNTVFMTVLDDTAGLGSGNALRVDPISTGLSIMGVFGSPVSVPAEIGSKLTLRFEMRNDYVGVVPNTFRFGLYDAKTNVAGDEETFPNPTGFGGMDGNWDASQPGSRFDPGVFVQQDNGNACCGLLSSTRLREETGQFGTQHGGGDEFNVAAPPTTSTFPFLNQSNGKNILKLEIERVEAGTGGGALRYTYTIDNGTETASLTGLKRGDISPLTTDKYDYVSMFYDGEIDGVADWRIDNITIDIETGSSASDGDYNEDGTVDAADYVAWRKDPASFGGDPAGYNTWRENFGETSPGSGGGPVPEPGTMLIAAVAAIGLASVGRRR